jgi:hypothetical protein
MSRIYVATACVIAALASMSMQARASDAARPAGGEAIGASVASPAARAARAERIERRRTAGISDGEAARIRYQMQQLKQMRRAAGADGAVTREEHARLQNKQQEIREMIAKAKSN